MNKLDKLYKLCEDENIQIEWVNFNPCILGLYISDKDIPPTIALNKSIFNDRLKTMEILQLMETLLIDYFTTVIELGLVKKNKKLLDGLVIF